MKNAGRRGVVIRGGIEAKGPDQTIWQPEVGELMRSDRSDAFAELGKKKIHDMLHRELGL